MLKPRIFCVIASVILATGALAQTSNNAQHFVKEGLSFDYPAGWTMDESKTTSQMQYLTLGRNGYATIMVRSPRGLVDSPCPNRSGASTRYFFDSSGMTARQVAELPAMPCISSNVSPVPASRYATRSPCNSR